MLPRHNSSGNVERFSGFADDYDRFRPAAPHMVVEILTQYFGAKPSLVVDLGCGTGLSSFLWLDHADRIIGVEPNADMLHKAQERLHHLGDASHIAFVHGYSNQLDLASGAADVVTCSQSFDWMEPSSTLKEVSRVLRAGGIFAAYDCDWPPTVQWEIEDQYLRLMDRVETIEATLPGNNTPVTKWSKDTHLKNMIASGVFRFTKEVVFHETQPCDAERYVGLALTQGGLQTVYQANPSTIQADIDAFRDTVATHFRGKTLDVIFSYRMRLGVK